MNENALFDPYKTVSNGVSPKRCVYTYICVLNSLASSGDNRETIFSTSSMYCFMASLVGMLAGAWISHTKVLEVA